MLISRGKLVFCFQMLLLLNLSRADPAADLGEHLHYRVIYQGLFSAGVPVDIAQVTLRLPEGIQTINGKRVQEARLEVTTAPYARMEALYPLRFSYASWFDPELHYPLLVNMRRQDYKKRHELLWFDRERGVVHRYRKNEKGRRGKLVLPGFLQSRLLEEMEHPAEFQEKSLLSLGSSGAVFDRLTMLYSLRMGDLEPGRLIELPVSNGKDLKGYRVSTEGKEEVELAGHNLGAFKLKFKPVFLDKGETGYTVFAWISDDARRLPLKFRSSHRLLGSIEVVMTRLLENSG